MSPAPGRSSKLTHTGVEIDTMCIPDRLSVVQCSHGHVIGVAFFWRDFSGVKRTCWTTGSWRSCLSLEVVSSIPAWSTIIYRFLCGFICVSLCQSIKIKPTNMYVASARAQFKINTHRCWNWHHVHSRQVVSCPVQPRARHWSCVFWRDFSGVKRTCWTTGSWRSCLSLEVVSSIPAWSTIIYRFLCGFICVSLCQSIKIKPTNMYVYMYVWDPDGFESCLQQRKTTCLLSIRIPLACARVSKLTTTNMYVCMYVCIYIYIY